MIEERLDKLIEYLEELQPDKGGLWGKRNER